MSLRPTVGFRLSSTRRRLLACDKNTIVALTADGILCGRDHVTAIVIVGARYMGKIWVLIDATDSSATF